MALAIYVDDMLLISSDERAKLELIKELESKCKLSVIGSVNLLLGASVTYQDGIIRIDQRRYIDDLLQKFKMTDCNPAKTPITKDSTDADDTTPFEDPSLYKRLVGSLIYAAIYTRPDITYAVGKVSQHFEQPTKQDWYNAKRILRYLKGTRDFTLVYQSSNNQLIGYADSDWASDKSDRKSTSGFIFMLGTSVISWSSKKQPIVALSSTEAEYISAAFATQEAMHLRQLLHDLDCHQNGPTTLYQDNQSAIVLANDAITTKRSKHIDIRYHYLRDCTQNGTIKCVYLSTNEMLADCLTKPVSREVITFACANFFLHSK